MSISTLKRIFLVLGILALVSCGGTKKIERSSSQASEDGFQVVMVQDDKITIASLDTALAAIEQRDTSSNNNVSHDDSTAEEKRFWLKASESLSLSEQLTTSDRSVKVEVAALSDEAQKIILSVSRGGSEERFTYFVRPSRINPQFYFRSNEKESIEYFYQ